MDLEKVAMIIKVAMKSKAERQRDARQRYRMGGAQLRKKNKLKQRVRRRQGGVGLKRRVEIQQQRLKYRPVRIRKEPLQKRMRDKV